jgi:hypothetical protein
MEDSLTYRVFGGSIINKLFVEKDVLNIFTHRAEFLTDHFAL